MFKSNNKMSRNNEVQTTAVNLVCDGTSINGDIEASRDIRIDGFVKGKIIVKGKVVVGPTGKVEGDITCQTIDVSGRIEGNIHVSEIISLKSSALVLGNIDTVKISVEPGAKFTGTCKMGNEAGVKNEKKAIK